MVYIREEVLFHLSVQGVFVPVETRVSVYVGLLYTLVCLYTFSNPYVLLLRCVIVLMKLSLFLSVFKLVYRSFDDLVGHKRNVL